MKYHRLVENAGKPMGFWGSLMIRSMNKGHSELTDWALSYLDFENGSVILDVGCGGGRTIRKLCGRVGSGKVYGIDYSELCVKKARKLNHKNVLCRKAVISQASVSQLPFEDEKFDFVTAVETYYFWENKLSDLKEILRTLKTGGRLLLVFEMVKDESDPDKWSRVEKSLGIEAVGREEMEDMLFRAGYHNIRAHFNKKHGWMCLTAVRE